MNVKIFDSQVITNEEVLNLLKARESFVLESIKRSHMPRTIKFLESSIEELGMRSRVFTKGRKALMAGMATPMPVTAIVGYATAIGVGTHNLITWNPDYEIAKNMVTGTLTLTFKDKSQSISTNVKDRWKILSAGASVANAVGKHARKRKHQEEGS